MVKAKPVFICSNCDSQLPKWQGRCPECGQWGTISEGESAVEDRRKVDGRPGQPVTLSEVVASHQSRVRSGIQELDRVLGDGIVPGSLILLGGDPGIGKSTL